MKISGRVLRNYSDIYNRLIDITYVTNPVKGSDGRSFGRIIISVEMNGIGNIIMIKYGTSSNDTIKDSILYKGGKDYEYIEGLFIMIKRDAKIEELGI
jgi:hypothetical protein